MRLKIKVYCTLLGKILLSPGTRGKRTSGPEIDKLITILIARTLRFRGGGSKNLGTWISGLWARSAPLRSALIRDLVITP